MGTLRSRTAPDSSRGADGGTQSDLTEEELFGVLSNRRRYTVLAYLTTADGPADFNTLVGVVAAEEFGAPVEELSRKQERRVYVALHQNHLPHLEDQGLIEWERNQGTVWLRSPRLLRNYLGPETFGRDTSYRFPMAASVSALVVVALATLSGTLATVPVSVVLGLLAVVLFVVSVSTYAAERGV